MVKYLSIIAFVLFSALLSVSYLYDKERKETSRLGKNQTNLLDSVAVLTLNKSEFKQGFEEQKKLADSLKIRVNRIESITIIKTKTVTQIKTIFKDSITITHDTLKCVQFTTPHLVLSGCLGKNNDFNGFTMYNDKITQIIHREPKFRLFGINFGTKGIRQSITFDNKDANIDYQTYIQFK